MTCAVSLAGDTEGRSHGMVCLAMLGPSRLASGGYSGAIKVWDTAAMRCAATLQEEQMSNTKAIAVLGLAGAAAEGLKVAATELQKAGR